VNGQTDPSNSSTKASDLSTVVDSHGGRQTTSGMPNHQVWGQVEALAANSSSSSDNTWARSNIIQEVNWQSSSDNSNSGGAFAEANVQPEPDSGGEDLPSVGSKGHAIGECKPCYVLNMPGGCEKGKACNFCHLHTKKCRLRPSKSSRALAKSQVQVLDTIQSAEEMKQMVEELLSQDQSNKYMQSLVKNKLAQMDV